VNAPVIEGERMNPPSAATPDPETIALFAEPDIAVDHRPDGSWVLESRMPLGPYPRSLGVWLERWAAERPDVEFLADRDAERRWRRVTYAEAWRAARSIGQALLDRGLGPERPVAVLSPNAVDHALVMLAGFVAGVAIVPVSPAYSLMSRDFTKLGHAIERTDPGVVYVAAVEPFATALAAVDLDGAEVVSSMPDDRATPLAELLATEPGAEIDEAFASVGPDTVAKVLFTSGSTGVPKGVVNTHRMLTSNQQSLAQIWPFTSVEPPVLLDWLPWSHTFGGNHNFNLVLRSGGTLYIDAGRPLPGLIETTIANIREVSPTISINVPAGFAALMPYLEGDEELAKRYFARLRMIFYAAAALPQELWDRIDALARRVTGGPVPMTSSWGSTETAPLATSAHFPLDRPGSIGVPVPGVTIKMAPNGNKLELMVKGPNVMPRYHGEPGLTEVAFDDEGFYRMGDAGRFDDPEHPERGIVFDGRVAEDFKLVTGTWVSVSEVRLGVVSAASPIIQDAVITGRDGDEVGVLAWISVPAAERTFGITGTPAALIALPGLRAHVRQAIERYNQTHSGSSSRVARLLLLADPPSIDRNEITDKAYLNQRAVIDERAVDVAKLHAPDPPPEVFVFERPATY
jgi:feruloyl-CoA synthase